MMEPQSPDQRSQRDPYQAKPFQTYEVKSGNPRQAAMEQSIQQGEAQAEANNMLGGGRRRMRHRRTVRLHKRKLSRKCRGKRHTKHRNAKRTRTRTRTKTRTRTIRRKRFNRHHSRRPYARSRFFNLRGGSDEQDGGEITVPQFSETGGSKGPNNMSQTSQKGNELRLQVMASRCGDEDSTTPCPA